MTRRVLGGALALPEEMVDGLLQESRPACTGALVVGVGMRHPHAMQGSS